jgi:hypothetical protein
MNDRYRQFRAALPEEACLKALTELRFGGASFDCLACGRRQTFTPVAKRRAAVCSGCGHALYPALGTPFEALRTSLTDWFFAVELMRGSASLARELERQAGLPPTVAERMQRELAAFKALAEKDGRFAGWLSAIAKRIDATGASAVPTPTAAAARSSEGAGSVPARGQARKGRAARSHLMAAAAGLIGAAASAATAIVVLQYHAPSSETDDAFAPTLSATPPRPSLTLAAVEDDLKAAKAAIEAVTKAPEPPPRPSPLPEPRPSAPPIASTGDPNDILTFGPIKVRRHLVETIVRAARVVGADPTLLMAVADKESSFATEVKAKTSSATGLYQFLERTWLGVVAEFGPKHGLDKEANAIIRAGNGYTISDPAERARILDLRREPYLSALMAGEMLRRDTLRIEKRLGRYLTGGEIYLVHFLGPEGARSFIDQVEDNPNLVAADLLPKPAEANKSIFYDKDGGRSVSEVHKQFEQMIATRLDRYREVRRLTAPALQKASSP